jgi:hypothetical protein
MADNKYLIEYVDYLTVVLNKELEGLTPKRQLNVKQIEDKNLPIKDHICGLLRQVYLATDNQEVKDLALKGMVQAKIIVKKLAVSKKRAKELKLEVDKLNEETDIDVSLLRELREEVKDLDKYNVGLHKETIFDIVMQFREKEPDNEKIRELSKIIEMYFKKILLRYLEYRRKGIKI